jgi:hypothetical protein
MKTSTASVSVFGILVIAALLVISILKIQQAHAQVDATSSDVVATTSTDTTPTADASTSAATDAATPTADVSRSTQFDGREIEVIDGLPD